MATTHTSHMMASGVRHKPQTRDASLEGACEFASCGATTPDGVPAAMSACDHASTALPNATPDAAAEAPTKPEADPDVAEAVAEAAAVATAVLDQAFWYVDRTLKSTKIPHDAPILKTAFAQHVAVQVARLQHTWTQEGKGKTVAALEGMGTGLQNLSVACGKHSLHVKLVDP